LPLRGLLSVQLRLTLRSHRTAEHAADLLGADIASTGAMVDALDALQLASSWVLALDQTDRGGNEALWERVQTWSAALPPHERERLRRLGRIRLDCADSTHRPTAYRIDALVARPSVAARVTLDADRAARVDTEILGKSHDVERRLRSKLR
jgi:Zn-dependent protease with chaperone function